MNGPALRDIHVPPAGWWPPAPGWWVLAGIVIAIALVAIAWFARHRRRAPLRAALREIDALAAGFERDGDAVRLADRSSRLLRRVARRIDPAAASRDGAAWRGFVHRYARGAATQRVLDELADARFRAEPALDAPALLAALRAWCRRALRRSVIRESRSAAPPALRVRGVARPVRAAGRDEGARRRPGAPGIDAPDDRGVAAGRSP